MIAVSMVADPAEPSDAELMNGQPKDQADHQQAFSPSPSSPSTAGPPAIAVSPTRPNDDDAIQLAPEGSKLPSPSGGTPGGLLVASERRLSFSQPEGRARSRSVGEKQWTRYVIISSFFFYFENLLS